jgi:glycosyltransferase involved in cell wall biosynthesis
VQKIKVLFMQSQTYFGADSLIHSLIMRYLDRRKFDVFVACDTGPRDIQSASYQALLKIPDITIRPTRFGPSINSRSKLDIVKEAFFGSLPAAGSLLSLAGFINKNQIDIIHCTEKPRDAFIGFLLSRMTGAKCVIHLHVKAEGWISPLVQWSMRRADALVGVSAFVAESMIAMGFQAKKVSFVLNSIDLSGWSPEVDDGLIRKEFGISPNAPLLAIISRLFYWKGHTELIKALTSVKAEIPNIKLLIVGEDDPRGMPGRKISYTAELKSLVSDLGLTEQVIFTGFRRDIHKILAASDLFTMPSFEEPFGMVFLEAMAMKKPVVALDSGGTPEIIEDGKSGLLSPPQDIEQLAINIVQLLYDPALRLKMGEYGRNRIEQYFTPERMACDIGQIYQKLIQITE